MKNILKEINFWLMLILIALIIFNIVSLSKQQFVKWAIVYAQDEQIKQLEQSLTEQIQEKQVYINMLEREGK